MDANFAVHSATVASRGRLWQHMALRKHPKGDMSREPTFIGVRRAPRVKSGAAPGPHFHPKNSAGRWGTDTGARAHAGAPNTV